MSDPFPDYNLILGTSSQWRHQLFTTHFPHTPFTTLNPSINERQITAGFPDRSRADPNALTLAIANAKADHLIATAAKASLLITTDQVLSYHGTIREKPETEQQCRQYLNGYAEHPVQTFAAVVVTNTDTGYRAQGVDQARQYFRQIPHDVIESLIRKGDVMHSAGGITVEDDLLAPYLARREGTLDSIMGLPISLLQSLIGQAARGQE